MMVTDPLADFLTILRNGAVAGLKSVKAPHSRMRGDILAILKKEGFIEDFELKKDGAHSDFHISLKGNRGRNGRAITCIKRLSKPGLRRYVGWEEAKKQNVGGELLLVVW
ncbi:MAG: 30S ribosomal protein S8 [Verrucomicrobia bacterium]|nr:30S ribosomal protein S8 [Verrucomicrobiota bacterium]